MNRLHRAGLGVLASLLLVATAGTVTSAGAAAPRATMDSGVSEKPPKKGERRYLYSASFTATVTNDLKLVLPGVNNDDVRHLSASLSGTHAAIEISTANEDVLIPRSNKSSVRVDSATVTTTERTDDGRYVQTCSGDSAKVTGPSYPTPDIVFSDISAFITHTSLMFPAACTATEGSPSTALYAVPPAEPATLGLPSSKPGAEVITYTLKDSQGTDPLPSPGACPGWVDGPDNTCAYRLEGTLTLNLVKELKPLKDSGKGASVSKGAKKATVMVQCPMACRIEVEVMPLRGSPRVLTRENMSLPPKKSTTVSLPIPAKNRAPAVKSGGVRIEITYRVPGVPAFTQTREARL